MTTHERRLVLVVDDDQRFIDAVRPLLQHHRTLTAHSLDEAREIVLGGRVDVVVLGPSHSAESAIVQAGSLRSDDPTVEVVLCADVVTNRILKAALRSGLADVLDLPLTAEVLTAVVDAAPSLEQPTDPPREIQFVVEQSDPVEESPQSYRAPVPPVTEPASSGDDEPDPERRHLVSEPPMTDSSFIAESAAWRDIADEAGESRQPEPESESPDGDAPPAAEPAWSAIPPPAEPASAAVWPQDPPEYLWQDSPPDFADSSAARRVEGSDSESITDDVSRREQAGPAPSADAPPPPLPARSRPPVPQEQESVADTPPRPAAPPPRPNEPGEEDAMPQPEPSAPGRVIAVTAGKGGSGKTVVATNLAIALGLRGDPERVAIVDADLQFGDVALLLQLDPVRTIDDVVGQLDGMSDARLDAALLRHESGLRVLPAPLLPVRNGEISAKSVVEVVERLRGLYDTIVVDTGPVFDDGLVTILDHADAVITVVDMDLPSVKNGKVALDALRRGGFAMDRITLVVNRVNSKARLDLVELERSLGLRVGGSVPSDRLVPQSVNEGIPLLALSPRSKVARAFLALAERFDRSADRERLGSPPR